MPNLSHTPATRKITVVAVVATLAVIAAAVALFRAAGGGWPGGQQVSDADPADIVHDFYSAWLEAAQSASTDPYREGLSQSPLLGKDLRARIEASRGGLDPVLCQPFVPERISTRRIYEGADKVEMLITARKPSASTAQAIVTLLPLDGGWYIGDISCSPGEFAPEVEFTFDREGQLAKDASGTWRLIFEEDGEAGHTAPLLFGAQSVCQTADGNTVACDPNSLVENSNAHVRGQMTERGVEVAQLELI